jgi:hypothetical protein
MKTQDEKFLKQIEEFSKQTDSLAAGIKMGDVRVKNRIIRALDDISNTAVSDTIRDKAKEQIERIKAIPNVATHVEKHFAGGVISIKD